MPMINENGSVYVSYEIPQEIDSRIPDYFYYAMAGELVSIFGPESLEKVDYSEYDDDGNQIPGDPNVDASYYDVNSGTAGWLAAFKMTCKKLEMMWLMEYREGLEWYDTDMLDGIIGGRIISNFVEKDHSKDHANCYYKHILGYEKEEKLAKS